MGRDMAVAMQLIEAGREMNRHINFIGMPCMLMINERFVAEQV